MENLYEEVIAMVEDGERFNIDFKNKTIRVGKKKYNPLEMDKEKLGVYRCNTKDFLDVLENMYEAYKHSLPSERSESKRRKYFYALPVEELSVEDMCCGLEREVSQVQLELWFLLNVIVGSLVWTDDLGKWYWHGKDKDLIVMKGWM